MRIPTLSRGMNSFFCATYLFIHIPNCNLQFVSYVLSIVDRSGVSVLSVCKQKMKMKISKEDSIVGLLTSFMPPLHNKSFLWSTQIQNTIHVYFLTSFSTFLSLTFVTWTKEVLKIKDIDCLLTTILFVVDTSILLLWVVTLTMAHDVPIHRLRYV